MKPSTLTPRGELGQVLFAVAVILVETVLVAVLPSDAARIATGFVATLLLLLLLLTGGSARGGARHDAVLVLLVLSLFPWVSTAVVSIPMVRDWLDAAPVPVAFLAVNALKLSSVVPLLLLAKVRGWDAPAWLVRFGNPRAGTGIPRLNWSLLGPIIIVLVMALFFIDVPAAAWNGVGPTLVWLPIMLVGAVVNTVSEELLYRHAMIASLRSIVGVVAAVVMSSVLFGMGHLTGNPGGVTGIAYSAGYGAVCAWAMLRTSGMAWNVPIHIFGDLTIVFSLTLTT